MRVRLVGTSYRVAPVEVRERLSLPDDQVATVMRELHELPGVREVVLISTCNRVEVLTVQVRTPPGAVEAAMARWSGLSPARLDEHLYSYDDSDAARHLFRVCSSLDSMVLGESQILGQVKEAYRVAADVGTVGPVLHRLLHKGFAVAKRIRTETEIGASTLSVARAAVDMAGAVFEDLHRHPVLLLGAGEMAELALRGFSDRGCRDLWVANRTMSRAADVAGPLNAAVLPWNRRVEFLATADIVVASTGARQPILSRADVRSVRRARRGRPLLLIDISVPRNLDSAINDLDSVYLFDIDDLGRAVESGREARQREAAHAEEIVAEDVDAFARVLARVHVAPLLRAVGQRVTREGHQEAERTLAGLRPTLDGLDPAVRAEVSEALERMAAAIAKRYLHFPMARIKELGETGDVDLLDHAAALLGVEATLLSVRELADDEPLPAADVAVGDDEGGRS